MTIPKACEFYLCEPPARQLMQKLDVAEQTIVFDEDLIECDVNAAPRAKIDRLGAVGGLERNAHRV